MGQAGLLISWWQSRLRWSTVRTTLIVIAAVSSGVLAISAAGARRAGITLQGAAIPTNALEGVALTLDVVLIVFFVWRRRWPVPLTLAACAASVVLPIDGFLPLVGLVTVVVLVRDWQVPVTLIAVIAAVVVSVRRDTRGRYPVQSFWRSIFTIDPGREFPWWLVALVSAVLVGSTVLIAVAIRARRQLTAAQETGNASRLKLDILGSEVARQAERERIAREVHDVLGHRLSLLCLHAGALEVSAGADARMAQSAALVRDGAQQSMADLRSLLTVLRTPDSPDVAEQVRTVADIPMLVSESLDAGNSVLSSIFIDQAATLHPQISHTTYRIIQELLTNARKHAPGTPVRLNVQGSPESGIEVVTTNWCRPHSGAQLVMGNGLTGIRERVEECGGQFRATIDPQGAFRVAMLLPWARLNEGGQA